MFKRNCSVVNDGAIFFFQNLLIYLIVCGIIQIVGYYNA